MYKLKNLWLAGLFLLILISESTAQSVVFLRGTMSINDAPAQKDASLKAGDKIKTGVDSLAILDLGSGSKLKVEADTEIMIETLDHETKGSLYQLARGKVVARARKIVGQKDLFNISTATASFGVRGTEFFVAVEKQEDDLDTWMCVNEGQVVVKGKNETTTKLVNQGEGVRVNKDGTSDPRFLPWTKKLNWELDDPNAVSANDGALKEAYHDPLGQDYD